jgi:hypothetical protein
MKKPSITPGVGFINYMFKEHGIRALAEHLEDSGTAELTFYFSGENERHPLHRRVNLLSATQTSSLVKSLEKIQTGEEWDDILNCIADDIIERSRNGEPAQEIWPDPSDTLEVAYFLKPLLYLNHPTVLFGDYGSLKSLFALVVAYLVQLPYSNNKLGLTTPVDPAPCLYLDYEDDPSSFRKRWSALERGLGQGAVSILYRRMTAPLADSVEGVQRICDKHKVSFLIIDSLGPAARGNLNDPEPAIRYHAALRQLGVTSLTLAHTAKDQITKKRSIFGSVFFTNLSRSVWECRSEQDVGDDEAVISLKHAKANLSRLHPPLGYRFTFTNNSIAVVKADLADTGLASELPLTLRIKNLLRSGAMTVQDIAQRLDANEGTVKTTVNRMAKKGVTVKVGDSWGLIVL